MGWTIRIFHISDLHGRSEDGPQSERARREAPLRWRVIREEWDKNLAVLREDGRSVALVVFTGDLGDWGHETDYAMGIELLRRTCQALGVPLDRLFVVPENHDIARKTEEAAWKAMRERIAHAGPAASDWMAGGKAPAGFEDAWRDAVLHRQANFWQAMTELGRAELGPWRHRHGRLGYQVEVPIDGLTAPLRVVGLDTAWLAGGDADTGSLWLTDHLDLSGDLRHAGRRAERLPTMFTDIAVGSAQLLLEWLTQPLENLVTSEEALLARRARGQRCTTRPRRSRRSICVHRGRRNPDASIARPGSNRAEVVASTRDAFLARSCRGR